MTDHTKYFEKVRDHLSHQLSGRLDAGTRSDVEELLADTIIVQREYERSGKLELVA